ncbi:MAG: 16S rRNA (cytosine(1402)-N(4))-methyltransferase RsmH [Planctomycetes bacterium]|nr:16S rRNA (cytosine(1402)-N(4))-methyltransferase RsmH [Planctomycetota bacterium]
MTESDAPAPQPHRRRPRYRGTHPRRFEEKYKEHAPELYPGLVEHVRERGMTPAGQHVSIMTDEVLEVLAPRPGERVVDATLGFGGHARSLLARVRPGGVLLGLDTDALELPRTEERLRKAGFGAEELLVRRTNFAGLRAAQYEVGWVEGADVVFADLGLSSMQIDDPARGFTFKFEGPLDMRMNRSRGPTAAEWLERATVDELACVLSENADEPRAERLARALDARRGRMKTTRDLAETVQAALSGRLGDDEVESSVRRVFQAIRIAVNDELGALDALLRQLPEALRSGGRVAILSFHSGEDRRVKHAFRAGLDSAVYAEISDEVLRPSAAERRSNPRSAPAKLRWARRA